MSIAKSRSIDGPESQETAPAAKRKPQTAASSLNRQKAWEDPKRRQEYLIRQRARGHAYIPLARKVSVNLLDPDFDEDL